MVNRATEALRARTQRLEQEVATLDRLWTSDHMRLRDISRMANERLSLRNRQLQDVRFESGELRVALWRAGHEKEVRGLQLFRIYARSSIPLHTLFVPTSYCVLSTVVLSVAFWPSRGCFSPHHPPPQCFALGPNGHWFLI